MFSPRRARQRDVEQPSLLLEAFAVGERHVEGRLPSEAWIRWTMSHSSPFAEPRPAVDAFVQLQDPAERLEESVRLRRELGFTPGVAAGVLALAELAARQGDRDHALALFDEAGSLAGKQWLARGLALGERTRAELA
jgi:hypothetical protein